MQGEREREGEEDKVSFFSVLLPNFCSSSSHPPHPPQTNKNFKRTIPLIISAVMSIRSL